MSRVMNRLVTIILALCLLFANTAVSPVAKAALKVHFRFVKPATLKVHKKASASSKVVIILKKDKPITYLKKYAV